MRLLGAVIAPATAKVGIGFAHVTATSIHFNGAVNNLRIAIVNVLSAIGHGEVYAWFVSAALLNQVKSTGARGALTMQVLEEAKHFVVMRELLSASGLTQGPDRMLLQQISRTYPRLCTIPLFDPRDR